MGLYKVRFDLNQDTAALIYLASTYSMDLPSLLFLYEKYGRDTFYFFYLLAGKNFVFPKTSKLLRIIGAAKNMKHTSREGNFKTEQERKVVRIIKDMYDPKEAVMLLNIRVANEGTREDVVRSPGEIGVCDGSDAYCGKSPEEDAGDLGEQRAD